MSNYALIENESVCRNLEKGFVDAKKFAIQTFNKDWDKENA